jgi:hypothetical protein
VVLGEVIVKFKGRVEFRQCIEKKIWNKTFVMSMGTYDMAAYLGKQLLNAVSNITSIHGRVLQIMRKVKSAGTNYLWIIIFRRLNCFMNHKTEK